MRVVNCDFAGRTDVVTKYVKCGRAVKTNSNNPHNPNKRASAGILDEGSYIVYLFEDLCNDLKSLYPYNSAYL